MQIASGTPLLQQLTPYHGHEPGHQRYVPLSRFHGSQRLNLMRPTRLPANSRRYTFGDPVQLIDWRAFARNEQLVIREQNDEASCRVSLVLEDTSTLDWPNEAIQERVGRELCTKREVMWRVALHIAYQSFKWGDTIKLYVLRGDRAHSITLRSQVDTAMLYENLLAKKFIGDPWRRSEVKPLAALQAERSDLLYWLSDGFQGLPDWLLQKKGAFACWIQILSALEVDTAWMRGDDCYFDEGGQAREYMGAALLQENYLSEALKQWQEKISADWLRHHKHFLVATDQTPIRSHLTALEQPWGSMARGRAGP